MQNSTTTNPNTSFEQLLDNAQKVKDARTSTAKRLKEMFPSIMKSAVEKIGEISVKTTVPVLKGQKNESNNYDYEKSYQTAFSILNDELVIEGEFYNYSTETWEAYEDNEEELTFKGCLYVLSQLSSIIEKRMLSLQKETERAESLLLEFGK